MRHVDSFNINRSGGIGLQQHPGFYKGLERRAAFSLVQVPVLVCERSFIIFNAHRVLMFWSLPPLLNAPEQNAFLFSHFLMFSFFYDYHLKSRRKKGYRSVLFGISDSSKFLPPFTITMAEVGISACLINISTWMSAHHLNLNKSALLFLPGKACPFQDLHHS